MLFIFICKCIKSSVDLRLSNIRTRSHRDETKTADSEEKSQENRTKWVFKTKNAHPKSSLTKSSARLWRGNGYKKTLFYCYVIAALADSWLVSIRNLESAQSGTETLIMDLPDQYQGPILPQHYDKAIRTVQKDGNEPGKQNSTFLWLKCQKTSKTHSKSHLSFFQPSLWAHTTAKSTKNCRR